MQNQQLPSVILFVGVEHDPIVTWEIINLLAYVEKSKELYQSHWIYGVETGGQATFIDIAPALLQHNLVNIFTQKLTERVDDNAKLSSALRELELVSQLKSKLPICNFLKFLFTC